MALIDLGLRQGVSMRGSRDRYRGTLPKLWAGDDPDDVEFTHEVRQTTFGIANLWASYDVFDDAHRRNFTIADIITHFTSGTTPISAEFNAAINNVDLLSRNGVIEPIAIRDVVELKRRHDINHVVIGDFVDGTNDAIAQFIDLFEAGTPRPYIEVSRESNNLDVGVKFVPLSGTLSGTLVSRPESLVVHDDVHVVARMLRLVEKLRAGHEDVAQYETDELRTIFGNFTAFDDTRYATTRITKRAIDAPVRKHFADVLISQSYTTGSTEAVMLSHRMSSASGFIYHVTPSMIVDTSGELYGSGALYAAPHGTDSLAFGGLLAYKVSR